MAKRSELVKQFFRYLKDSGMKIETVDASYGVYAFEYRGVELYVFTDMGDDVITLAFKYLIRGMPSDKEFNFNRMLEILPDDYKGYQIELLPYGDCCMSWGWQLDVEDDSASGVLFKKMLEEMFSAVVGLISAIRRTEKKYDYY
ncbi:MAG: hypothetical protein KHX42_00485 [Prevotella sp.]|nr:hypothetical protein [Prevotella sp.]